MNWSSLREVKWVATPIPPADRLSSGGIGASDGQAAGLPDWEGAEADWDPAEAPDWDPAELAEWDSAEWDPAELDDGEREDLEEEPLGWALPEPAASAAGAERLGLGHADGGSREALKPAPGAPTSSNGGWFAAGGVADDLLPGPQLARFMADAGAVGLGRLSDDELIGLMRAARRLASWSAAMELAAAGDLWRRRWSEEQAGNAGAARHTDDEIAAALTLTKRGADQVLSLAIALRRLPQTSQALTAGDIDLPRAMVIADEVTGLGNEHAAAVEQAVIGAAAGQTTGQLRAATRRAVLSADPRAARKRKERALQDARVERWDEHGGTAALAGRDLPPASVLAADKNLSALARQLKRAGAPGTLDQLRAQVYLALLTGSPVGSLIPANPGPAACLSPDASARDSADLAGDSPAYTTAPGFAQPGRPSAFGGLGVPADPGPSGTFASPGPSGPFAGPGTTGASASPGTLDTFAGPGTTGASASPASPGAPGTLFASGSVNLTMPLASWLGLSDAPGNVAGFGPLDADDSRAIANALSARADTRWCLTLTDSHGRPVAHGCARAGPPPSQRRPKRPPGPPGPPGVPESASRDGPRTGTAREPAARAPDRTWTFSLTLLAGSDCDHARETAAYRPSPGLRHLVEIRHATCTYPGCRRPATHCDADHTMAYHRGGRTCLCNLAPLCRTHHQAKQAHGWHLNQPQPGTLTWTTPSGRRYTVTPTSYPS
jgi:hypothetical protein